MIVLICINIIDALSLKIRNYMDFIKYTRFERRHLVNVKVINKPFYEIFSSSVIYFYSEKEEK